MKTSYVSNKDFWDAYWIWYQHTKDKDHTIWPREAYGSWKYFLGNEQLQLYSGGYKCSEEAANRIRGLLGPYAAVLIKARYASMETT